MNYYLLNLTRFLIKGQCEFYNEMLSIFRPPIGYLYNVIYIINIFTAFVLALRRPWILHILLQCTVSQTANSFDTHSCSRYTPEAMLRENNNRNDKFEFECVLLQVVYKLQVILLQAVWVKISTVFFKFNHAYKDSYNNGRSWRAYD